MGKREKPACGHSPALRMRDVAQFRKNWSQMSDADRLAHAECALLNWNTCLDELVPLRARALKLENVLEAYLGLRNSLSVLLGK